MITKEAPSEKLKEVENNKLLEEGATGKIEEIETKEGSSGDSNNLNSWDGCSVELRNEEQ